MSAIVPGGNIRWLELLADGGSHLALGRMGDRILARFAQRGEMLSDAQEDAALAGFDPAALRLDIGAAGFAHRGDPHEGRLAWLGQILEVRLDTFAESISSGTKSLGIPAARLDRKIICEGWRHREKQKHCKGQTRSRHLTLRFFWCLDSLIVRNSDSYDRPITSVRQV